jgi:hypothetical protein
MISPSQPFCLVVLIFVNEKMSSNNYRICLALFSWGCFVSGLITDVATMYKGQELKFFIYLTNWGLILLNTFLTLEVCNNFRKLFIFILLFDEDY